MGKTRVLIAEDDPISLRVVETMLKKWGYDTVTARDGVEALEALTKDGAPQLAVLDWMMPKMDGVAVCRAVRGQAERPYTYILLVTAKAQGRDLTEGLGAGADDYLTKPFAGDELRARLFAGERILSVQQELLDAREALRAQAIRDPLTGLFNRRYLVEALERELHRAEHGGQPVSLLMFDLDHFKNFNDTYGHQAGDALLERFGALVESRTRREDIPCRYGGEEFVLILPGVSIEVGRRRAEDLRLAIREANFEHEGRTLGATTVSVGVTCFPDHGSTLDSLLRAADQALYRAKQAGRDCVTVYEAPGAGAPTAEAGRRGPAPVKA